MKIVKKYMSAGFWMDLKYGFETERIDSWSKTFEGYTLGTLLNTEAIYNDTYNKAIFPDNSYVHIHLKILAAVREQFPEDLI